MLKQLSSMLKRLTVASCIVGASVVMAADDRTPDRSTQYKCYFIMADGTELVNYMMSKDNYAQQLKEEMTGGSIFAKDGVTRLRVREAIECVEADKEFNSFNGRQLDKRTLS